MEVFSALGIDWKLLLAQGVNFLVLLVVLHRFAYRPLLKILNERQERIEQGLKDADAARAQLEHATKEGAIILAEARKKAEGILSKSQEMAEEHARLIEEKATKKGEETIIRAEKTIENKKQSLLTDIKQDLSGIVMVAVEKILEEKLDDKKDKKLIERALS